ncbi:MAG: hypothetical protein GY820_33345, partial [Gammaproteobacteria bacterium]|nr:hypothetical protein [Gammaproteobacteria bacterium]
MTNNEIKQAIENFEDTNYEPVVWAIRAHHNSYGEFEYVAPEVGGELENSYVWHDGNTTSEQLDGVCALEISDIDTAIDMIK